MNFKLSNYEYYIDIVKNSKGNILFCHGFTSSFQKHLENWRMIFASYNFFAINVPGHGKSPFSKIEELDLIEYVKFYQKFIEILKIDQIIIIGHSMGGAIAGILANKLKNILVKKVIMINPANLTILKNSEHIQKMIPNSIEEASCILQSLWYDWKLHYSSEEILEEEAKNYYQNILENYIHLKNMVDYEKMKKWMFFLDDNLKKTKLPILLCLGINDKLVLTKPSYEYFQNFSNIKIAIIPDSGHQIMFENKDFLWKIIFQYLNK